ncbi:hypothetical protein [Lysobacter humi (ex Lee et al. 2017)]
MNALTSLFSTSIPRPTSRPLPVDARPLRRERDFGIGYGSSSGYAASTRYTSGGGTQRLRFS